jgi:thiol-disulfide isomerase/thioredoxin
MIGVTEAVTTSCLPDRVALREKQRSVLCFILVSSSLLIASPDANVLTPIDAPTGEAALAPNLRAAKDRILLTWLERIGERDITPRHKVRISALSGTEWSEAVTIHESAQIFANWADVPSVQAEADGQLLAHWPEKVGTEPYAYEVALARSLDGKKWTRVAPANEDKTATEHGFVSMTVEKGGVRVFWLDGREMAGGKKGSMTLRSAVFGDAGAAREVLDSRVCECCGTDAAETEGGPIIVYRDRDHNDVRDISIVRRVEGRWTLPKPVHRDGWKIAGCPVNGPSVDARGRQVAVAWFTAASSPEVRIAFSEDSGATFGVPTRVDSSPKKETLGRVDVALAENGDAIVTWLDAIDETNATIRVRRIRRDGRTGAVLDLVKTTAARASGFPQIAKTGNELIVAWTEVGPPTRVRVAKLPIANVPAIGSEQAVAEREGRSTSVQSYSAKDLADRTVSLSDLKGRVVLINVWATWCAPCRKEMPVLQALEAKYKDRGLTTIGVSVDEANAREAVRRLVRDAGLTYAIWLDPQNKAQSVFEASALPKTVLIDRSGRVTWSSVGRVDVDLRAVEVAIERAL